MNVLIACEESQRVCEAFRERGHNAFSCDIVECSGGHPEWHIMGDALEVIEPNSNKYTVFFTQDQRFHTIYGTWDLIIAHPPCTYLTVSGNRWFDVNKYGEKAIERARKREEAYQFFMEFVLASCPRVAIENPIGYMNTHYRKPDQIIQPYYFGDPVRKPTCLWLKGLPPLEYTDVVEPKVIKANGTSYSGPAYYVRDDEGKILPWNDPRTAKARSKTYPGIAEAMAEQWG